VQNRQPVFIATSKVCGESPKFSPGGVTIVEPLRKPASGFSLDVPAKYAQAHVYNTTSETNTTATLVVTSR
jgi:hypothetical protein